MIVDRRSLIQASAMALIVESLGTLPENAKGSVGNIGPITYGLTNRADPAKVAEHYQFAKEAAADLPYAYLYYDIKTKRFSSALDVVPDPTNDSSKSYTLSSKLHAFNISSANQNRFAKLQQQVQLAFNVTAPNPTGDLTWVFMNAIDIFGSKAADEPDKLTSFLGGKAPGALASSPKITVTKGTMNLQVLAYGQHPKGFWRKFFDVMTSVVGSPNTASALKGFGIPGLAVDALQFVDHAISELTKNEGLDLVWKTGALEFGTAADTKSLFKFRSGIWIVIDHDYAASTDILDGHSLELALGSYRLLNMSKKSADANYLVCDLNLNVDQ